MPAYLRGKVRDQLSFVRVSTTQQVWYGFKTKDFAGISGVSQADIGALGHFEIAALPQGAIKFFAANSPKPPRVKKTVTKNPTVEQQGSVSSYCSVQMLDQAQNAGWDLVQRGRGVSLTANARSTTVGAKLTGGGIYVFPMNTKTATDNAEALGLLRPTQMGDAERDRSFSGSSKPRPAKVAKALDNGTFSSFCSSDALSAALQAGYSLLEAEFIY